MDGGKAELQQNEDVTAGVNELRQEAGEDGHDVEDGQDDNCPSSVIIRLRMSSQED